MKRIAPGAVIALFAGLALLATPALPQSFTSSPLAVSLTNPTALQFGPDGRLYVAQQYGELRAYSIVRNGPGAYVVSGMETITAIRDIQNHDDDASPCSDDCSRRQVTGLLTAGSAAVPVLYVSSSDPRISVALDSGLDTNSGIVTRLTCSGGIVAGQCQSWERVDIVRGLPRSEENHAVNGMSMNAAGTTLYLAVGGNTNKGAPSSAFSGTKEYYLAGAILAIDLTAIAALEAANGGAYIDLRSGERFVYDLLTLDDPTRANINNTHPAFPYASGHPRRNFTIDIGDPFGGNNGYNQALPEPGGPVQIHSAGYRNSYDVLMTESGDLYTWDNGPNSGWGGTPVLRDVNGVLKGYSTQPGVVYNPGAGDYCTNERNENASATIGDGLQRISAAGFYGGHPAPIRAFPERSGLHRYVQQPGGSWSLTQPVLMLADLLPSGHGIAIGDFPDDPRQCDYIYPQGALEIISDSTNGLAEYRADNFNGAMQGDLLAASFNGNVYRCKPDGNGGLVNLPGSASGAVIGDCEVLLSGFGSMPLDVTAQGDQDIFPGTIWAATYGASSIVAFEPIDFDCDPNVPEEDSDGDGYSNGDEFDNNTNPCSAGSVPDDWDGDFVSDLNDPDDDNDGVLDVIDVFALDPLNGIGRTLPLHLPLFNNNPGTGLFGLGFTGLMLPLDGVTTWLQLFDREQLAAGGAAGLLTVEAVQPGLDNGFLFGIDIDSASPPFIATTRMLPPYFEQGGSASAPLTGQRFGLFLGTGDQQNYFSVAAGGDGSPGARMLVTLTVAGVSTTWSYSAADWGGADLLAASSIEASILVNPKSSSVQARVSLDGGASVHALGPSRLIPQTWIDNGGNKGIAVGALSTSGASATPFGATWDYFNVAYAAGASPGAWSLVSGFNEVRHEGGFVQAGHDFHILGGRESNNVRSYDPVAAQWRTGAASPILLHHFQAVELDGLIYIVGAMTGQCCTEPPAPNVYIYDPLADRWTTGPPMPAGRMRGGGGAVAVDGLIYLVSGNTNGHYGPVSNLVDVYDPASGRFSPLSPIPNPRDHFFVAHHQGRIYAAAGRDSNAAEDGNVFDDTIAPVDVYHIAKNTWITLPPSSNLPTPRAAAPTGIIGNELIVAGGESDLLTAAHAETEAFDLEQYSWRTLAPMRTPRHGTQAIVSRFGFYVAAGSSQRGGPTGTPLDLEVLHLFGSTTPEGSSIVAGGFESPATLEFGQVSTGDSATLPLRIAHTGGNQAVIIDGLVLGSNPAFRLVAPPLLPFVLAPGATIDLQVEFAPMSQGSSSSTLSLTSPGGGSVQTVLNGEGFGSSNAVVLYRVNVGGPQLTAIDAPAPNWSADTAATGSPFHAAGGEGLFDDSQSGAYPGPVVMTDPSLPPAVPSALFQSERWDPAAAPEMRWSFPIATGTQVEVRLYFAELFSGITGAGQRVCSVRLQGAVPAAFTSIDRYAVAGAKGAMMRSALVTVTGGSLELEFLHEIENPALNGIEIRAIDDGGGTDAIFADGFEVSGL